MRIWRPIYAITAAVAAFLIVGAIVTEVTQDMIAFSALVGLPVGILIGVSVGAVVWVSLGSTAGRRRRVLAVGLGAFGVTFVVVMLLVVGGFGIRNSVAMPIAVLAGVIAGVATALHPPDRFAAR